MTRQFSRRSGPLKFTMTDREGNKHYGECYVVSIGQGTNLHGDTTNTVNFTGTHTLTRLAPKKLKKKVVKKARK